ncbi:MAG: FKBP-type peptidyl-prolyl cis-trans isomerase [Bacteroidota bacterium]|nr:FKBP-type peptidyl-prolyl cis-trans isomerase [Candidatus Kapabacteria bacterium]MDW8219598.1 FKBP-type peptidyl-prolyl cis-trans isomerase [Bacteroidota bacterium]
MLLVLCTTACLTTDPPLDMSGELKIEDIVIGTGATVSLDTNVVTQLDVLFSERLLNGTFTVGTLATQLLVDNFTLVPGLDQGLRGMRVGGRRIITVPPRLGYGNRQVGNVPPNSTIIYDITLRGTELFLIEDIQIGTGAEAKFNSTVSVRYVGRLRDGRIFDATAAGDPPFSFRIGAGSVIRGWEIGVNGMKVGGKRRLTIPSLLGYGNRQQGTIPPNSTLIFDIELLSVSSL